MTRDVMTIDVLTVPFTRTPSPMVEAAPPATAHMHRSRLGRRPIPWDERYNEQGLRRCTRCLEWKERSDFGRYAASLDGLRIYCRACAERYDRDVRERQRARSAIISTEIPPGSPAFWAWIAERVGKRGAGDGRPVERYDLARKLRLCSCCYTWKRVEAFGRRRTYFDGLSHNCIDCNAQTSAAKRMQDSAFFSALDERRRAHRQHLALLRQTTPMRKPHKRAGVGAGSHIGAATGAGHTVADYLAEQPA